MCSATVSNYFKDYMIEYIKKESTTNIVRSLQEKVVQLTRNLQLKFNRSVHNLILIAKLILLNQLKLKQ